MATKRIENEEQYQVSVKWLVDTSIKLADPLLDGADRAKLMTTYDYVTESVRAFHRAELAEQFPGLRKVYAELGWTVADPPAPAEKQSETQLETAQEKTVNLSDWLDD